MVTRRQKDSQPQEIVGEKRKRRSSDNQRVNRSKVQRGMRSDGTEDGKHIKTPLSKKAIEKKVSITKLKNKTEKTLENIRRHNGRPISIENDRQTGTTERRTSPRKGKIAVDRSASEIGKVNNNKLSRIGLEENENENIGEECDLESNLEVKATNPGEEEMEDDEIVEYEEEDEEEENVENVGERHVRDTVEDDGEGIYLEGSTRRSDSVSNERTVSEQVNNVKLRRGSNEGNGMSGGTSSKYNGMELNSGRANRRGKEGAISEGGSKSKFDRSGENMTAKLASTLKKGEKKKNNGINSGQERRKTTSYSENIAFLEEEGEGVDSEPYKELRRYSNVLKSRLKKALDENQDLKNHNSSIKLQMLELNRQVVDLKIELASLRNSSTKDSDMKRNEEENRCSIKFVRSKSGRRVYSNLVDEKYRSIVDRLKVDVKIFTNLEVIEMERKEEDIDGGKKLIVYYNWEGRVESTGGDADSGTISRGENMFEGNEAGGFVAQCPINAVIKHGMFTPSKQNPQDRIAQLTHSIMESDVGRAIREADQVTACVKQISNDRAVIADYKNRIANAVGVRKKATRNRFTSLLGYTMINTRTVKAENMSHGQKVELNKQHDEFKEKVMRYTDMNDNEVDFSWWRYTDASELSFSEVSDQFKYDGMDLKDNIFRNQIGKSVYNEYMGGQMNASSEIENTIASIARVDVWIFLVAKFGTAEREKGRSIQVKYSDAQSRYLPLAVQQILCKVRSLVHLVEPSELTLRMNCAAIDGDMFNNKLRNVTKVVMMKSLSKCYVVVKPKWFAENVSIFVGKILDCYIGSFDVEMIEEGPDDEESLEIRI